MELWSQLEKETSSCYLTVVGKYVQTANNGIVKAKGFNPI